MKIVDLHCDTLFECYAQKQPLRRNSLHIDLERLRSAGALAQFFAVWLPQEGRFGLSAYELFQQIYELYRQEMEKNKDLIAPALSYRDIVAAEQEGRLSSVLCLEDGSMLEGDISRLDGLYSQGVRQITLTWNGENSLGYPNSPDPALHARGLKPFGIEVVERMEELGMLVDVSHLSEGGFWDVCERAKKPFLASHSCARALCDHPRDLTDRQLRALAERGGIVGVNFYSEFLEQGSRCARIEDILRHVEHIRSVAGEETVALGSDFDGIDCELEMKDYSGYPRLIQAAADRWGYDFADRLSHKNALRLLKDCL